MVRLGLRTAAVCLALLWITQQPASAQVAWDPAAVVRAYVALVERGTPGEVYNVGAGQAVAMSHVLGRLIAFSPAGPHPAPSPARLRPVDVPLLVADTIRLRRATGWEPKIPLEQTLVELLASWRGPRGKSLLGKLLMVVELLANAPVEGGHDANATCDCRPRAGCGPASPGGAFGRPDQPTAGRNGRFLIARSTRLGPLR